MKFLTDCLQLFTEGTKLMIKKVCKKRETTRRCFLSYLVSKAEGGGSSQRREKHANLRVDEVLLKSWSISLTLAYSWISHEPYNGTISRWSNFWQKVKSEHVCAPPPPHAHTHSVAAPLTDDTYIFLPIILFRGTKGLQASGRLRRIIALLRHPS